ncbi:MAG: acylneuraminate cytidylyltransferase family protein [Thermodesulfobacteriota bacterium]
MNEKPEILGLIPARGGSKSVPLKNIAPLAGHPLVAYTINAAKKSESIGRVVCSTDSPEIRAVCLAAGIEVLDRPAALAGDNSPVLDTIIQVLEALKAADGYVPEAVALLQPTSPFVLPGQIDECVRQLLAHPEAGSVQTITALPHNCHAYNQREIKDGYLRFRFAAERAVCYNKQTKPKFYLFGNLIVTRTTALLEKRDVFAPPSLPVEIPPAYATDVDGPDDFERAEFLIERGKVQLPPVG